MTQIQPTQRFDTAAVVPVMNEHEARQCVIAINNHLNSARALLLDLYERRGWQALGYASWRECATTEFKQSQTRVYELLQAAEIERRISAMAEIGTIPERQLRPLAKVTPIEQPLAWQRANEIATEQGEKLKARHVEAAVQEFSPPEPRWEPSDDDVFVDAVAEQQIAHQEERRQRTNAGVFSSATPEWYTPSHIIDRVIAVFGQIDLDPCSNSDDPATANVPACSYFTKATNGLLQAWHGRVYMNPPYGDEIKEWVEEIVARFDEGEIDAGIALLPARTDTAWFRPLFQFPCCFLRGRLKFSGSDNSAPFPSVVVYLGHDVDLFHDAFADIGEIVRKVER